MKIKLINFFKKYLNFIILSIGAICFFFSSGKYNIPIFAWIYPFCFLYFVRRIKTKWFLLIPVFLVIFLGGWKWFPFFDEMVFTSYLLGCFSSVLILFPLFIDYFLVKKISGFKSIFIFPLSYTSLELILLYLPFCNTGNIAATQTGFTILIQSASLFGSLFITFIITLFPTTILYIIYLIKEKKNVKLPIIVYGSIFMSMMFYGGIRVIAINNLDTFRVAMVANYFEDNKEICLSQTNDYLKIANSAKADILVASEEYVCVNKSEEENIVDSFKTLAKENNIYFLAGIETYKDGELGENKSYLFDNKGNVIFCYIKSKLVPFDEVGYYVSGDGSVPNISVTLPSGKNIKLASMICFDGDFAPFVRNKIDNDVGTLLVPTWDWGAIRDYHSQNVIYRAIENGCSFVRSTYDGISSVITPTGKVTTSFNSHDSGLGEVIIGDATYKSVFTLYKYIGIVTDWMFPASFVGIITYQIIKNKKQAKITK